MFGASSAKKRSSSRSRPGGARRSEVLRVYCPDLGPADVHGQFLRARSNEMVKAQVMTRFAGIDFPSFFDEDLFVLRRNGHAFTAGNPYDPESLLNGAE